MARLFAIPSITYFLRTQCVPHGLTPLCWICSEACLVGLDMRNLFAKWAERQGAARGCFRRQREEKLSVPSRSSRVAAELVPLQDRFTVRKNVHAGVFGVKIGPERSDVILPGGQPLIHSIQSRRPEHVLDSLSFQLLNCQCNILRTGSLLWPPPLHTLYIPITGLTLQLAA